MYLINSDWNIIFLLSCKIFSKKYYRKMLGFLKEINCCRLALFLALTNIIEVLCYLYYSMKLDMNIGSYQAQIDLKNNDLQKEIARLDAQNKVIIRKIIVFD
jgi:hypothetical protein